LPPAPKKVISQLVDKFLSDQKIRLSPKTFAKYKTIIDLFRTYLECYGPDHYRDEHPHEFGVTDSGDDYRRLYSPEEITRGYSEFLGYFMPHEIRCGKETMKDAGTVMKKFAKWLAENGYVEETSGAQAQAKQAAKDLPAAQDMLKLLNDYVSTIAPDDQQGEIGDHFWIKRIEPGQLWLKPLSMYDEVIGPVPVPHQVTQICDKKWGIGGVVMKTSRGWRFLEVWNVTEKRFRRGRSLAT
jgi:hypothetical protein